MSWPHGIDWSGVTECHDAIDSSRNLLFGRKGWNKSSSSRLRVKNREDLMDRTTRCPKCGKRMIPVVTISGRTDLQCKSCDGPVVKWAESPPSASEKPTATERD